MLQFRENIIKQIIKSVDKTLIEPLIENSLLNLSENGTHPFIIIRFIDKLKAALSEIKKEELSEQERNNILHTLYLLNDYDVKKLDVLKTNNKLK